MDIIKATTQLDDEHVDLIRKQGFYIENYELSLKRDVLVFPSKLLVDVTYNLIYYDNEMTKLKRIDAVLITKNTNTGNREYYLKQLWENEQIQ